MRLFKTNPSHVAAAWWGFYTDSSMSMQRPDKSDHAPILCTLPRHLREELENKGVDIEGTEFEIEAEKIDKGSSFFFRITSIKPSVRNELSMPVVPKNADLRIDYAFGIVVSIQVGDYVRKTLVRSRDELADLVTTVITDIQPMNIGNIVDVVDKIEDWESKMDLILKIKENE